MYKIDPNKKARYFPFGVL